MALADVQALFADLVRDVGAAIATAERDRAIAAAVLRYAEDRPRVLVADVTAAAAGHVLPLPDGWVAEWSRLTGIEYPVGTAPPTLLPADLGRVYRTPDGEAIQFDVAVAAGAVARLTFTSGHTLDSETDTIPERHRIAVAAWAAALALDQLATLRAGDAEPTIAADSVDHAGKAERYGTRARNLRRLYAETVGAKPDRLRPAGAIADLDGSLSSGGDFFHHPRRRR